MHSICIFSNVLQHLLMKYATDTHMKGANVRAYLCTLQREWMMLCSGHTVTRQQRSMLHTWGISHSDNSGTVWEGNVKARRTDSGHTYTYECLSLSSLALKVLKSILHTANLRLSWGSETHSESRQMWHNHDMKMQAGRGQRMLYFTRFSTAITCNKVLSMQFIDEYSKQGLTNRWRKQNQFKNCFRNIFMKLFRFNTEWILNWSGCCF